VSVSKQIVGQNKDQLRRMNSSSPSAADPNTDRVVLGVGLMIAFCVVAPLLDVASKLAADKIPVAEITTSRFVLQAVLMAPMISLLGHRFTMPQRLIWPMTLRALLLIASTYCFVAAISVMPIADALAIVFVEPFILLVLGKWLLKEQIGPRRLGAAVVGFAGVVLVIQPSFSAFGAYALFPLATAVGFAGYMLSTRSISRHIHPVPMQFHTALIGSLLCVPVMIWGHFGAIAGLDPVWPHGIYWLWLLGVGLFATISHLLMTFALRFAPSTTLAPLHYLEIVSAVFFGYVVFADFPNKMALFGMIIIIGCGFYIFLREQKMAQM